MKRKTTNAERRIAKADAMKLLQSPYFFRKYLLALKKLGLVGEEANALVLLIVTVSRLLACPLSVLVKGHSSAGKNRLVTRVLRLMPENRVSEVTSLSERALNYEGSRLQHCVLYLQERNESAGNLQPIRQFLSEGKLIHLVTRMVHGQRVTKRNVAQGPFAAISTTTRDRLEIDDETRHVSIWVDESREQTREIIRAYCVPQKKLTRKERRAWRMVHHIFEQRIGATIGLPGWFQVVGHHVYPDDLSVRRYFPSFVEACRTVCLIRSFQPDRKNRGEKRLTVDFADFAIATLIFESVFVESLHRKEGNEEFIRRAIKALSETKKTAIGAKDLAKKLHISRHRAYAELRDAEQAGVIRRANQPERHNRKRFIASPRPRFLPDPKMLFPMCAINEVVRFVHPITGEWIEYRPQEEGDD